MKLINTLKKLAVKLFPRYEREATEQSAEKTFAKQPIQQLPSGREVTWFRNKIGIFKSLKVFYPYLWTAKHKDSQNYWWQNQANSIEIRSSSLLGNCYDYKLFKN